MLPYQFILSLAMAPYVAMVVKLDWFISSLFALTKLLLQSLYSSVHMPRSKTNRFVAVFSFSLCEFHHDLMMMRRKAALINIAIVC